MRSGATRTTAPLFSHDPVVFVPVVMRAAGGGEDLAAQQSQAFGIDAVRHVVGPDDPGPAFDRGPLPAGPEGDGDLRPGPEIRELRLAVGDEGDRRLSRAGIGELARVDD